MIKRRRRPVSLEPLEGRSLLSGMTNAPGTPPPAPDATLAADVARIRQDQQTLAGDRQRLAPTLAADRQALENATLAASGAASAQLKAERTSWESAVSVDRQALKAATTDPARASAQTKLSADLDAAGKVIAADLTAVARASAGDPAVVAARARLQADAAPLAADQAALDADIAQYQKDRQTAHPHGPGGGTTTPPPPNATVQADLDRVAHDRAALSDAMKTLAGDQQALSAAVASATRGAVATLKSDSARWESTLSDDLKSVKAAASDSARRAAQARLTSDRASASAAFTADLHAVQSASANDHSVQSSRGKLQADARAVADAQAGLKLDSDQLLKDQNAVPPSTTAPARA